MLAKDAFLTLVRLGIETENVSSANTQSFCGKPLLYRIAI